MKELFFAMISSLAMFAGFAGPVGRAAHADNVYSLVFQDLNPSNAEDALVFEQSHESSKE